MNLDPSFLVPALLAVGVMLLVGFPVHEFSHAFAAFRLGDSTARYQGRLTLDPRRHFDPLGGTMLVISAVLSSFFIGWAKPTPVNPYNLAGGHRGEAIVALAGPLSNLVLAAVVAIPVRVATSPELLVRILSNPLTTLIYDVGVIWVFINVSLFIFNLLPIPPLDGWRVLLGALDPRTAYNLRQYEQYGFILLLLILLVGGRILVPVIFFVIDLLIPGARVYAPF